jgi:alkanesulfonate monooxygenase SsuD/methylene tetrahydromethanopterin reductase-like flavin-dependent oxidoreductase (luciferase family)
VNPWIRPYQKPHPQVWVPGSISRSTVQWAARNRHVYVMLDSQLHLTQQVFDIYREEAARAGYEAGPQHLGYMFRVHVDDTEEKAYETGRKLIEGPGNVFLDGSNGQANIWAQNLPGLNSGAHGAPVPDLGLGHRALRRHRRHPDSVLPKIRHVLETLRPGNVFFWHGDGDMTHEEAMRGIRYMGEYVLPAVREMGQELGLRSAFEINTQTNEPFAAAPSAAG